MLDQVPALFAAPRDAGYADDPTPLKRQFPGCEPSLAPVIGGKVPENGSSFQRENDELLDLRRS